VHKGFKTIYFRFWLFVPFARSWRALQEGGNLFLIGQFAKGLPATARSLDCGILGRLGMDVDGGRLP